MQTRYVGHPTSSESRLMPGHPTGVRSESLQPALVYWPQTTDIHPQLLCEVIGAWVALIIVTCMWCSIATLEKLLRMYSFKTQSG